MSHITTVKSKISNLELLKSALDDLKYKYNENSEFQQLKIKSWNSKTINLDGAVLEIKTGTPYNIGVVYNETEKKYGFVADWWGIETYTQLNEEQFINKITQKYAYKNIMNKINDKGYHFVEEKVDDKNNIRIVVRKWG